MASTVADVMVATLKASGVRRVYGIPGDSLNGFTDALRRDRGITWEHVRHEEAAGFAAAGEAAVTGELAVCAASCGPGNLHLINGLFDANRSRVPVLAIAAHIPREEIGGNYFQETHPQDLFRACSSREGRGVQQRRAVVRGTGDEGGRDRHRHRSGQSRLCRNRPIRRIVRGDRGQGRRTGGCAARGVRSRRASLGRRPHRPHELALPPKLTYGEIKGFTLYATRTILSGEGEELVELARTNLRDLDIE
jgi:hypothetical protein